MPALSQSYAQGLSLWSHQIIRRQVIDGQDRVSIKALAMAKRKIQEIVEESKARSSKKQTRSKLARWQDGHTDKGDSSVPDSLPNWFGQKSEDEEVDEGNNPGNDPDYEGWSLEQ